MRGWVRDCSVGGLEVIRVESFIASEVIASRAVDNLLLHADTFGMNVVLEQSCTRT